MKFKQYLGGSLTAISVVGFSAAGQAQEVSMPDDEANYIVVTGTKRDQQSIEAPMAVSVFSEKEIEKAGITRPQDFISQVPSVNLVQGNNAGEVLISMRGQNSARLGESSVTIIIDGVQLASTNEFSGELFDIAQIEVLKGPQSAIYGRNASAGAIVITTKQPTDEFEGQITGGWGNWNSVRSNASLSGPIIEGALRFRVSLAMSDTDGPFTNINTGEKVSRSNEKTARLQLSWDDGGPTTADLRASVSRLRGGALAYNPQLPGTTIGGVFLSQVDANNTSLPWTADVAGSDSQNKFSVSLKLDHEFDWGGTLTSISGFNNVDSLSGGKNFPYSGWNFPGNDFVSDEFSPGLPLDLLALFGDNTQNIRNDNKAITQEIRLTSPSTGRLRWQAGGSFLYSDRGYEFHQGLNGRIAVDSSGAFVPPFVISGTNIGAPVAPVERTIIGGGVIVPGFDIKGPESNNPTLNVDAFDATARNFAVFANAQFDITDALELSVAGRYDIERRKLATTSPDVINPFFGLAPGATFATFNACVAVTGRSAADCRDAQTFKQFQPKVSLVYKFTNASVYASWGKGFKSGGFNNIGTRAIIIAGDPNSLVQDGFDKEVSESYEAGFKLQLLDRRLSINGAAFKTDVSNSQLYRFFPTGGVQAVTSLKKVGIEGVEADFQLRPVDMLTIFGGFSIIDTKIEDIAETDPALRALIIGNRAPYIPSHSVNAGAQLNIPVSDSLTLSARTEYSRTGSMWFDETNAPNTKRKPLDLVDARVSLGGDDWEISGWVRNITNEIYNQDVIVILPNALATYQAGGRSYGTSIKYKF